MIHPGPLLVALDSGGMIRICQIGLRVLTGLGSFKLKIPGQLRSSKCRDHGTVTGFFYSKTPSDPP